MNNRDQFGRLSDSFRTDILLIIHFELEWSRYKYAVLEKSPNDYKKIRELLKDKSSYPAVDFYRFIEHAYAQELITGNGINASLHIWGYFKGMVSTREKERFFKATPHNGRSC